MENKKTINSILENIQQHLNAPKGQYNKFGKYHYRSCEDILSAVKPLLEGCILEISDVIVMIGVRYYVKATATIRSDNGAITTTAYAREAETKKGMDESQITGAASSYARKYALNGLFCIDDTKDADSDSTPQKAPKSDDKQFLQPTPTIDPQDQAKSFIAIINDAPGMEELAEWYKSKWPEIKVLPEDIRNGIIKAKDMKKSEFEKEVI